MLPIEITVKIQPNAECITPLPLGNITYQYPTTLTTDKISEIVTTNAPIGYSRFAAIYGGEPSVSVSRSSIITNGTATVGSANLQSALPLSSIVGDADDQIYTENGLLNPGIYQPAGLLGGAYLTYFNGVDTPRWSRRDSSVYFPQVDFFPRYNQWFASTIWSTPYDPSELQSPASYDIMFVYVDRSSKIVYYRPGIVNLSKNTIGLDPSLNLTTVSWGPYSGGFSGTRPWYLNIAGLLQNVSSGAVKFQLFFIDPSGGDNLAKEITSNSPRLPSNWGLLTPTSALGSVFKIKVVAVLQDDSGVSVTSNELAVSNPNA
jgi:hypothetical protein